MTAQTAEYKARRREIYAQDKDRFKQYNNKWKKTPGNLQKARQAHLDWIKKYPYKDRADSIAKRLIPLKSACEICSESEDLQRHHKDYGKPLEVLTLCRICHDALEAIEPSICSVQPDIRFYKGCEPVEILEKVNGKRGQSWSCKVLATGEIKDIVVGSLCYLPHKIKKKKQESKETPK